jgi:PAS domain S-box-containing protein
MDQEFKEYEILLNEIDILIWYINPPDTIQIVNRAFADFFGKDITWFRNKSLDQMMPNKQLNTCLKNNLLVFESGKKVITKEWVTRHDGIQRLWRITKQPKFANDQKTVKYLIAIAEDITDEYTFKLTVEEYEKLNSDIIDNINEIVYIVDLDWKINFISNNVFILLGYTPEKLLNKDFRKYIHPNDIDKLVANSSDEIIRVRSKDNKFIFAKNNLFKKYSSNTIIGSYGILSELNKTKDLELLNTSKFDELFNNKQFAIFISKDGVGIKQNKKALDLFGYTQEEILGKPAADWIAEEDKERVLENIKNNYTGMYVANMVKKDGTKFKALIQAKMIVVNNEMYRVTFVREFNSVYC